MHIVNACFINFCCALCIDFELKKTVWWARWTFQFQFPLWAFGARFCVWGLFYGRLLRAIIFRFWLPTIVKQRRRPKCRYFLDKCCSLWNRSGQLWMEFSKRVMGKLLNWYTSETCESHLRIFGHWFNLIHAEWYLSYLHFKEEYQIKAFSNAILRPKACSKYAH